MVGCFKRIIIVREAGLSENVSSILFGKMSVFVSRPIENVTFHRKTVTHPKLVVDFLLKNTHSKKHGNRRGFCV